MDIPHMKEKLEQMAVENQGGAAAKAELSRPAEILPLLETESAGLPSPPKPPAEARQPALLLQWMEKERQKRYKYFHQQRDFVKTLSDISERMRAIDPPQDRKKHLPAELKALVVPDMAYVPLGRVSDPFCRITRVLTEEGTVFSTHSRAPCLLCFEVIEDQVNSAGQRRLSTELKGPLSLRGNASDTLTSQEVEVAGFIKRFAINGQLICVENPSAPDEEDDDDVDLGKDDGDEDRTGVSDAPAFPFHDVQSALSSPTSTATSDDSMRSLSEVSGASSQSLNLIRGCSKTAYEMGLSKLLSATEVFGEGWQAKKERIRATSPYGHLPDWNVVSLVRPHSLRLRC